MVNDSGSDNQDGITADPTLSINVRDASTIASLQIGINASLPLSDITNLPDSEGNFSLLLDQLAGLNGGELPDGEHALFLEASDTAGNQSERFEFRFTLDTTAPELSFGLAAEDDTDPVGDHHTEREVVTLVGESEPHSQVTLLNTSAVTIADESGEFEFSDVVLAVGENVFSVEAIDRSGNRVTQIQTIHKRN